MSLSLKTSYNVFSSFTEILQNNLVKKFVDYLVFFFVFSFHFDDLDYMGGQNRKKLLVQFP